MNFLSGPQQHMYSPVADAFGRPISPTGFPLGLPPSVLHPANRPESPTLYRSAPLYPLPHGSPPHMQNEDAGSRSSGRPRARRDQGWLSKLFRGFGQSGRKASRGARANSTRPTAEKNASKALAHSISDPLAGGAWVHHESRGGRLSPQQTFAAAPPLLAPREDPLRARSSDPAPAHLAPTTPRSSRAHSPAPRAHSPPPGFTDDAHQALEMWRKERAVPAAYPQPRHSPPLASSQPPPWTGLAPGA
jgi:hypothetical protein